MAETLQHPGPGSENAALQRERHRLLRRIQDTLETPTVVLAFIWLALLVGEFVWGESAWFEVLGATIWAIFIVEFVIAIVLVPDKLNYLKHNWLTAIALLVPALRIFRVTRVARLVRFARAGRSARLLRVITSLNRGMKALAASLNRRGFGYVFVLTSIVTVAGAAGMYTFEKDVAGGLQSFGEALWWTAMIMTTMGSQFWPQTVEGRLLCLFLSLYAFAVFGYVTASLATYFVGRDAATDQAEIAGAKQLAQIRADIAALREELLSRSPLE